LVISLVGPITGLVVTHKMLLGGLLQRMDNYQSNSIVGDVFMRCLEGFQAYEQFYNLWGENALATLKKSEFSEQLKKFEIDNNIPAPEACEFISQRIFNISYIVVEILRSLPSHHEDIQYFRLVLQKVDQIKTNIQAKPSKKKKALKVTGWNKNT